MTQPPSCRVCGLHESEHGHAFIPKLYPSSPAPGEIEGYINGLTFAGNLLPRFERDNSASHAVNDLRAQIDDEIRRVSPAPSPDNALEALHGQRVAWELCAKDNKRENDALRNDLRKSGAACFEAATARDNNYALFDKWHTKAAEAQARIQELEQEVVEERAKLIYERMDYDGPAGSVKPGWVERGNSDKQNEARREARDNWRAKANQ